MRWQRPGLTVVARSQPVHVAARSQKCHLRGHAGQATMRRNNIARPSAAADRIDRSHRRRAGGASQSREPMDAIADAAATLVCVRSGAGGLPRPRLAAADHAARLLVSVLAALGLDAPQGGRLALRAVPHRHRGVPPLRGDRPPLSLQRVRRAGGGRGQGPPEAAAARGVPPRHRRPAAGRRRGRHRLDAVRARQARRDRLCGARSCPTSCRRTRPPTTPSSPRSRPTRSWPASSCPTTASWRMAVLALDRDAVAGAGRQAGHRRHQRDAGQGAGTASASSRTSPARR